MKQRLVAALLVAGMGASLALSGCGEETPGVAAVGGNYGSFFGIAPSDPPNDTDFARMAAGGIGSYHVLFSWQTVESLKGKYDWSSYDILFRQLAEQGIEPLPYVIGTPAAYAPVSSDPPTTSKEAFDAWATWLRAAAQRYGPGGDFWQAFAQTEPGVEPQPIHVWEIWNEENSSVFWTPAPDAGAYADLFKRSSRVIKSVDPSAKTMVAGMFITPQSEGGIDSLDFLRDLYRHKGVAEAADIVGLHPYGPNVPAVMGQVDKTRKLVDELDPGTPLWVTEVGWGSDPSSPNELAKTPEQQADLLRESLGTLLSRREELNLLGVVWFTWRDVDTGNACGWCATAGLVEGDRETKPAWLAFTDLTGGTP